MTEARKSLPLTRMAVEAILIVVSILLAFGIDAWWDDRKLAIEEAELIVALEQEFLRNRETLLEQAKIHAQILELIGQLVVASRQGQWADASRAVDDALAALTYPGTTDLEGGVLEALVSASRFEIISDLQLRTKLAGWGAIFAEVRDDEHNNSRLVFDYVMPYLIHQHVPLSQAYSYSEADDLILMRSLAADEGALSRILNDPKFTTLCEIRYSFLSHTTGEYQQALDAIDSILEALEKAQRR